MRRAGSTLEMDSGHKNKEIDFYPKSLRPFLQILYVVDDSIHAFVEVTSRALPVTLLAINYPDRVFISSK